MRWRLAAGAGSHTAEWRFRATARADFLPGVFIALEGIDGSGKSTIAERLVAALQQAGTRAILTREPGGTAIGEQIRTVLLGQASSSMLPDNGDAALRGRARSTCRRSHSTRSGRKGSIVVTDRFSDSSLAYQWGARGLAKRAVSLAQELATGGLEPDLKILLDLPVETALRRRMANSHEVNRLDREADSVSRPRARRVPFAGCSGSGALARHQRRSCRR